MKRKTLTLCLSLLACLSLIGVGFAAWVISSTNSVEETGSITVDTVSDERYTVALVNPAQELDDIYYGWDKQAVDGSITPWLINDENTKAENLSVSFNITVTAGTELVKAGDGTWKTAWENAINITDALTIAGDGKTAYDAAVEAKAIIATGVSIDFVEGSSNGKTATYTVTIKAGWGDVFKVGDTNVNPYKYYNDGTKTVDGATTVSGVDSIKTWGDHASYYLKLVEAMQTGLTYSLEISVAAKTA